ncbi:hypothetical protein evm_003591 [Chilo suppressalis]|nr:hypothetical protein evm_003591 [Chilo suppressalis]
MDFGPLLLGLLLDLGELKATDDITLTTAKVLDEISPKPTAMHRRIQVETNFEDRPIQPLDLFRLKDKELRRSRSNVWNWDYWCKLQHKTGNCSKPRTMTRYYYDAHLDQCLTFLYSGCGGNRNQFETIQDCERLCKGATYMPEQDADGKNFCSVQPNSGLCMAMFYKYYFDVNENRCKTFIYGGCGGNQNRFNTMSECMNECQQDAEDFDT